MIRRLSILFLLIAVTVGHMMANPVTQAQAEQMARNFITQRPNASAKTALRHMAVAKSGAKEIQPYYVFNAGDDEGFVIVSGEDRFANVIAYADRGRFTLDGIAPAPRGIPQIEVTFDIDANGIVNVSAKDLGTGKEQKITITASTNLSQDEIDKAMHEAEKYAEQDKKNKEAVEVRNSAEQLVFQSEKALTDLGDKLSADEKAGVQAEIEKVKEALKGTDTDMIKAATDGLSKKFSDLAGKIYQQQAPQGDPNMGGQPGAGAQSGPQGDFVDADFTEVKDDDKK